MGGVLSWEGPIGSSSILEGVNQEFCFGYAHFDKPMRYVRRTLVQNLELRGEI